MNARYTGTAIALHWGMALLLITLVGVGFYMQNLPVSPWKLKLYSWHKWAGVTAFLLAFVRLLWRATHQPPAFPASMTPPQRLAAHAGHGLLYLLMLGIPLSGWLMSSAKGFQTVFFGVLPIPDLLSKNQELAHTLGEVHEVLNFLLIAIVAGHVLAAIKHHWFDRDDVLTRMLPFQRQ